jgi:hypothetical protein
VEDLVSDLPFVFLTPRIKLQMSMGLMNNVVAGFIPARKGLNAESSIGGL